MALAEKIQVENDEYSIGAGLKRKRRVQRKPQAWIPAVGLMLCLAVGNVIIQGLVVHKNFQIRSFQKRIEEKERQMVKLRIDIANLESFDHVREIARTELGMKTAGPEDYQIIPAVPRAEERMTTPREYIAQTVTDRNVIVRIVSWLNGVGKTMANTP